MVKGESLDASMGLCGLSFAHVGSCRCGPTKLRRSIIRHACMHAYICCNTCHSPCKLTASQITFDKRFSPSSHAVVSARCQRRGQIEP
ncbi:hypothetical protein BDV37DRAFT_256337 [Aspergillus pseudonomiae]|uniref:Uncharacterized protein n=1 Tax=Aspergillus pseudonomiae TaxID=1506151 RepID=A0A5N7D513_9EURO|nr:uncharacterized protein BDV37DRAFT_256337 [Aspergillus pseudonomiae]KAE8400898.1 hypothetical protein BDV37DRAFT_256337 [Aspergillus pseudonomiae]